MIYIERQGYWPTAEGQLIGRYSWAQGNKAVQDAGGFFDLILTEAANMANSVPEMFDPLAAIGMLVASICLLSKCFSCSASHSPFTWSSMASRHARWRSRSMHAVDSNGCYVIVPAAGIMRVPHFHIATHAPVYIVTTWSLHRAAKGRSGKCNLKLLWDHGCCQCRREARLPCGDASDPLCPQAAEPDRPQDCGPGEPSPACSNDAALKRLSVSFSWAGDAVLRDWWPCNGPRRF